MLSVLRLTPEGLGITRHAVYYYFLVRPTYMYMYLPSCLTIFIATTHCSVTTQGSHIDLPLAYWLRHEPLQSLALRFGTNSLLWHDPFYWLVTLASQVPLFVLSKLLSSVWVSRTENSSDFCALQEELCKCIDTIQYNTHTLYFCWFLPCVW